MKLAMCRVAAAGAASVAAVAAGAADDGDADVKGTLSVRRRRCNTRGRL